MEAIFVNDSSETRVMEESNSLFRIDRSSGTITIPLTQSARASPRLFCYAHYHFRVTVRSSDSANAFGNNAYNKRISFTVRVVSHISKLLFTH